MKRWFMVVVSLAIALALAACTVGTPATPTLSPTMTPTAQPSATPTAAATPTTAATATPTVPPFTLPTPSGAASPCAADPSGEPAVPPDAQLTSPDGVAVKGSLGSYTFCGTSADALPPRAETLAAVALGSPANVSVEMLGGWGITGRRAGYWAAAEWQGDEIALANTTYSEPVIATSFDRPPTGDWMLAVHVAFPANGNAIYYWHVTVP